MDVGSWANGGIVIPSQHHFRNWASLRSELGATMVGTEEEAKEEGEARKVGAAREVGAAGKVGAARKEVARKRRVVVVTSLEVDGGRRGESGSGAVAGIAIGTRTRIRRPSKIPC